MSRLKLREAYEGDFEQVYPLLRELDVSHLTRENLKRIFRPSWQPPRDARGYILADDAGLQGFLGTLIAKRTISGREVIFCNMTSWIVRPAARAYSLSMIAEMMKVKGQVFTNFTPSATVARVLEAFKFQEIERSQRLILPVPRFRGASATVRLIDEGKAATSDLANVDAQVFRDHRGIGCVHVLLEDNGVQCYAVFKRLTYRKMPVLRAHYIGNPELFGKTIGASCVQIALMARTAGVMVEERYLDGRSIRWSLEVPGDSRWFFHGPVSPAEIDTAYSEMVLLHA